jgi:hypothetical protein
VLNPFVSRFRYPGLNEELQPDETTARDALRHATDVVAFVEQRLPSQLHPGCHGDGRNLVAQHEASRLRTPYDHSVGTDREHIAAA